MTFKKGSNVAIGENVSIGENVTLGNNVTIYSNTIIGSNVIIMDNVVVGKNPTKAKISVLPDKKDFLPCEIGSGVTIGTSSIIYINSFISDDVFVADLVTIREKVSIGKGTIIGRGVSIENNSTIGGRCKLETNCYITAYSILQDYVFIAPGVITSNDNYMGRDKERYKNFKGVTVKKGGRIGANATILPGITIHEDGAVAAGSIVTKDVSPRKVVLGNPARELRDVPHSQLLKNQEF